MGDVADILGLGKADGGAKDGLPVALALGERKGKGKGEQKRAAKPAGMSREVYALLGKDGMPPVAPTTKPLLVKGIKAARKDGKDTKWLFAPFSNSARKDGLKLMHWVKAGVEYPDYPYARYNVHWGGVSYTPQQYSELFEVSGWTKQDTDKLVAVCQRYDLCWPVIFDRCSSELSAPRPVEQLQHRYYSIAARLRAAAATATAVDSLSVASNAAGAAGGAGGTVVGAVGGALVATSAGDMMPAVMGVTAALMPTPTPPGIESFNLEYEQHRKQQLNILFHKTAKNEQEEEHLREELKLIEQQIKKFRQKKDSSTASKGTDEYTSLVEARKGLAMAPAPGQPYLQSMRLTAASQVPVHPMSKQLLKKMKLVLAELHIPSQLVPSKAVCDLYDALQKDVLTMLSLRKIASKKEAELLALKQQQQTKVVAPMQSLIPSGIATGGDAKRRKLASGGPSSSSSKGKRVKR